MARGGLELCFRSYLTTGDLKRDHVQDSIRFFVPIGKNKSAKRRNRCHFCERVQHHAFSLKGFKGLYAFKFESI